MRDEKIRGGRGERESVFGRLVFIVARIFQIAYYYLLSWGVTFDRYKFC